MATSGQLGAWGVSHAQEVQFPLAWVFLWCDTLLVLRQRCKGGFKGHCVARMYWSRNGAKGTVVLLEGQVQDLSSLGACLVLSQVHLFVSLRRTICLLSKQT